MQFSFAHHRDQYVQRLLRDAVDLLYVQQRALAHRADQRTVDEHLRVIAVGEYARRVEVPDEPGRGQLGIALDELEPEAELKRDSAQQRALASAGRPLEQHMTIGVERSEHEFYLTPASDDTGAQPVEQCAVDHDGYVLGRTGMIRTGTAGTAISRR